MASWDSSQKLPFRLAWRYTTVLMSYSEASSDLTHSAEQSQMSCGCFPPPTIGCNGFSHWVSVPTKGQISTNAQGCLAPLHHFRKPGAYSVSLGLGSKDVFLENMCNLMLTGQPGIALRTLHCVERQTVIPQLTLQHAPLLFLPVM